MQLSPRFKIDSKKVACQAQPQQKLNTKLSAVFSPQLPPTAITTMSTSATEDPLKASPRSKRAQTVTGAKTPSPKPLQSSSPKKQYLILYNFISALAWLVVLGRVVLLVPLVGFGRVYPGVGYFAKWTQTVALLEIVHAATGLFLSELSRVIGINEMSAI